MHIVLAGLMAVTQPQPVPIIPAPREVSRAAGAFVIDAATALVVPDDRELRAMADAWAERIRVAAGVPLPLAASGDRAITIRLAGAPRPPVEGWDPGDESYTLDVRGSGVVLEAPAAAGLFRGLQTLRQLLPPDIERPRRAPPGVAFEVPALRIADAPRFRYRGMHLDVGRHFFPPDRVKRYIDLLALYGFNTFHWHLTEDQGWRIQIRSHPRLTEVGAWRAETILGRNFDPFVGDGIPHGGFYTQDEVRDVVAYAAARHITIVPEIEMPGHSLAALAAYPELACTEGPFEVGTRWGVYDDILCPSEETFAFLEDVLDEVMELFPGRYIHIGGDEAPKRRWEESELAREVMRREGLADAHELQSWFIRRIERYLLDHGRRLIGWDEILEGGLAPEATVMSWRGTAGGIAAATAGHDVIMTPNSHVYFDHYQGDPEYEPLANGGFSPLEHVYAFDPVPPGLSPTAAARVLGGQGNVWTEYIKTWDRVEYMVFPRALALAEVLWSPADRRDLADFLARLEPHLRRLEVLGVGYRVPDVLGLEDGLVLGNSVTVSFGPVWTTSEIRYTTDGSVPTDAAHAYTGPFTVDVSAGPVQVRARRTMRDGRRSAVAEGTFERTTLRPAERPGTVEPGLRLGRADRVLRTVDDIGTTTPEGVATEVAIPADVDGPVALRFEGLFRAHADGVHAFHLTSDDGSRLRIGNHTVVDNDGPHAALQKTGRIALAAGWHPIVIDFFDSGGGRTLRLEVTRPDGTRGIARPESLGHR